MTVGTDGNRNYLRDAKGGEFNLGTASVLDVALAGTESPQEARDVAKTFLDSGEVTFTADMDKVDELLQPVRPRYASNYLSPEPPVDNMAQDPLSQATKQAITNIEREISLLEASAKDNKGLTADQASSTIKGLKAIIAEMRSPGGSIAGKDQSDNSTYYKLGSEGSKVEDIFQKMSATSERIRKLASEGRKFNHKKALQDVYEVTMGVTGLLDNPDLKAVGPEVEKLASRADQIHSLFFPGKQGG